MATEGSSLKYCMSQTYIGDFNKFIAKNKMKPVTLQMMERYKRIFVGYEDTDKKYMLVKSENDGHIEMEEFDIINLYVNKFSKCYYKPHFSLPLKELSYMLVEYE